MDNKRIIIITIIEEYSHYVTYPSIKVNLQRITFYWLNMYINTCFKGLRTVDTFF